MSRKEYDDKAQLSEMIKTYLTAQKMVWQSDGSAESKQNAKTLLKGGNGQVAVNKESLFGLIRTVGKKPAKLLDYGLIINELI